MTQIEALNALIAKVEADARLTSPILFCSEMPPDLVCEAYHGSLDAAKALREVVLPGWDARVFMSGSVWVYIPTRGAPPKLETEADMKDAPARAFLLAIIRAKIAELGAE